MSKGCEMRNDINFDNLISKIDCILNSPKPIPNFMKKDKELAQMLEDLQEISEYETFYQFEELFDKEPFLMQFLIGSDFAKLLKIIDRTTMKYEHLDDYTPLHMLVVNPNIANVEKTVVIDRILEMGCNINQTSARGETALLLAVKRNNRKMIEYLLKKGANPNISNDLGITPMMVATFNSQLYNMAILKFFNAYMGATCTSYQFDVFDIAEITKISNTMEVLRDLKQ